MTFKRNYFVFALVSLLLFLPNLVQAAQIDVSSLGLHRPALVTVLGQIESSDYDLFLRTIAPLTTALVALNSDGGNLVAGIQIGETIRLKNFATVVLGRCASSCALAWLGGTRRFMAIDARIGFHAASDDRTGEVTSAGNALIGAYLNKIGLPYSAVLYITSPAPASITWLNKSDAEKLGIEVSLFSLQTTPHQSLSESRSGPYFVQVSSGRTDAEARVAYRVLQEKFSMLVKYSPIIQKADLGDKGVYFRANIGPFGTADDATEACKSLKSAGGQCVVMNSPAQSNSAVSSSGDRLASIAEEIRDLLSATNKPNAAAIAYLQQKYSDQVAYFGKALPKANVLSDKMAFF